MSNDHLKMLSDRLPELESCADDIAAAFALLRDCFRAGNSENVLYAVETAQALDLKVLGLTGGSGGRLKDLCDVCITAPINKTYRIQELHLPIYHSLALMLEQEFFGD
jgi:phosphoheptose isomerase